MKIHPRLRAAAPRFLLGLTVASGSVAGLAGIGIAWFFSQMLAGVFLRRWGLEDLWVPLAAFFACVLGRVLAASAQGYAAGRLAAQSKTTLRKQVLDSLLTTSTPQAQVPTRWLRGIDSLESWYALYLPQVFIAMIVPTGILLIAFRIDVLSGLVFLLTAPLLPIFLALIGMTAQQKSRQQWKLLAQQGNLYLETLLGLRTLRQFGRSRDWGLKIASSAETLRQATLSVLRLAFLSSFVLEMVGTLGTAIIAVEIGLRLLHGHMEYQPALFVLVLAPEFYLPLRQLGLRAHAAMEGDAVAQVLFPQSVDNVVCNIQAVTNPPFHTNSAGLSPQHTYNQQPLSTNAAANLTLSVTDLKARWPGQLTWVLHNINFQIHTGEFLAIAGSSGSGKSTLLACIRRELTPEQGSVYTSPQLRTTWVPQHPRLFHRSLRDNLWMQPGASHQSDNLLWSALEKVGLADMVRQESQGLDTLAGEGGLRLSGGEQRRLCLARALVQPCDLVLLDEPDAHLDSHALTHLEDVLHKLTSTRLVVSHRAQTLAQADQVLFMQNGTIVACAPHEQLLAEFPAYRALLGCPL